ncbi:uncharacterized protein ZBAI_04527 [Zygosaccharomyces bailii ISA1307]|nr:uncharacterized protein ZBAI_04527 [Zygosaccharomyces bailii ISA1307]
MTLSEKGSTKLSFLVTDQFPQVMLSQIYQCATDRFIHCYTATKTTIFIVESTHAEPWKVQLLCLRHGKITSLQYPIHVRRSDTEEGSISKVKKLSIVSVPHVDTAIGLELRFYLVVHMSDGIQICPVSELVKDNSIKIHKWIHTNSKDIITSCYAQGTKDERILVTYSTLTGQLVQLAFNVQSGTFTRLPLPRALSNAQDTFMDHLNNIAGLRDENYPTDVQEQLWKCNSDLALSCLDNTLYAVIDGKLEYQPIYELQDENMCIWADLAVAKRYTNSSLRFFVANITNVGCILYKRSTRGHWELVQKLQRTITKKESSPLVDCFIMLLQRRHTLRVISGSEDGKLYLWDYDYFDDTIVCSKMLNVAQDIVHSISLVGDKLLFLNRSNSSIAHVLLH